MKILLINTLYESGSTGKIVKQLSEKAVERGHSYMIAHRYSEKKRNYSENIIPVSSWLDCHMHNRLSQHTMLRGQFSKLKTKGFIKKAENFKPHIIHLHNIHGNFINLPLLFRYIKRSGAKVVWTLHDCWALTGWCKHFDMAKCKRWKEGCGNCPQKGKAFVDISARMLKKKQEMISGVENMIIVTPSEWLADLTRKSYLDSYPVKVINNGIDLNIFMPTESNFRQKNNLEGKKILLGVAFDWGERKGLDVFIDLASRLDDEYQIILVGTNDLIDQSLPSNIISIHRTNNQRELAEIYTAADLFVNPTREDTYPTVNMEALACGTPVITFKTGGSPEIIDETCGFVVEKDDMHGMYHQIIHICEDRPYTKEACFERAKKFDMNSRFEEYVNLYEELI